MLPLYSIGKITASSLLFLDITALLSFPVFKLDKTKPKIFAVLLEDIISSLEYVIIISPLTIRNTLQIL